MNNYLLFFDQFSIEPLQVTGSVVRVGWIIAYVVVAAAAAQLLPRLVQPLILSRARLSRRRPLSERRIATLSKLTRDVVIAAIYGAALILILSLFVASTGLWTFIGLFSAGFGLGARPLVSDYVSGIIFLFEDQYSIGEKIEIFGTEGTVEDINLRTTMMRAPSGELFIVPNGEIRTVRNFSRGTFSMGTIHVDVPTNQLEKASAVLAEAVARAPRTLPDLIETPDVISEDGLLGVQTRFTIVAKARYGRGASVRRELLTYIYEALEQGGIGANS